jgi:hypothetical protein
MPAAQSDALLATMKRVVAALRDAEIAFAIGGGLAAWARGGPPTEHDVDVMIRECDADRALGVLGALGMATARPPEGWLVKAWDGTVLVDLIYRPSGLTVDDAFLDRCDVLNVHAVAMRVMTVNDLLTTKLLALTEHNLDYAPALEWARALREQIDWSLLEQRTGHSPFARAFFTLVDELGVSARAPASAPRTVVAGAELRSA